MRLIVENRTFRHQASLADTAPAHLNLGVIHAATGRREQAVRDYETAVSLDPGFLPARLNLATLLNEMGRNPDAPTVQSVCW